MTFIQIYFEHLWRKLLNIGHIIYRIQYTCSKDKCSIGFNKLHKHIETEKVQKLILRDNNAVLFKCRDMITWKE